MVFGGWPYLAFQYIMRVGGLTKTENYEYCMGTGKCYPCVPEGYNETLCGPPPTYCNATVFSLFSNNNSCRILLIMIVYFFLLYIWIILIIIIKFRY